MNPNWQSYDDLTPALAEFEQHVRTGSYQKALYVVNVIGGNYLRRWGYGRQELDLRQKLVGKLEDPKLETLNTYQMGHLYKRLAYYQDALRAYEQVLPAIHESGDRAGEGRVLSTIGATYWSLQDYDQSLNYLQAALTIAQELGEHGDESFCLNQIGLLHSEQGRKREALAHYQQSLAIYQDANAEAGKSIVLANIALVYIDFGTLTTARDYAEQALVLNQKLNDRAATGACLFRIGSIDALEGNYNEAIQNYRQSETIAAETGDRRWHSAALRDIAALYPYLGSAAEAEANLTSARTLVEDISSPELLSTVYSTLARHALLTDNFVDALRNLQLATPHTIRADWKFLLQRDLGLAHWRLDQASAAEDAFNACLDEAAELLNSTDNLFSPKYARGLALAGLALVTDDRSYLDDARTAYQSAIDNCAALGVLNEEIARLDILAGDSHEATIAPLRAMLAMARGGES